jgi:hypothetical protein
MNKTHQQWEQLWLPLRPLASDDLRDGIYRMSRESALGVRYIEANPQAISNLLIVDIDHSDAVLRALWGHTGWLPNAVIENPENGHAHAVWALHSPIPRTEYAHRKPLAYAAAVTEGLRRAVDGDAAYSGLITKNPTHDAWDASWHTDHLYSLDELSGHLTEAGHMPPPSWKRTRRRNPAGLGRNCALFESARTWAYPLVRNYETRTPADSEHFYREIFSYVHELNQTYSAPLPLSEATQIAKSIHKWITTHFYGWIDGATACEATFITIQSARGIKSGQARQTRRDEKLEALFDDDD